MDHNLLTVGIFLLGVIVSILGLLMRGWFNHVNENLIKLWQRYDDEAKAREERWNHLHEKCELHSREISELRGRLNGKTKAMLLTSEK